jgi:hypothetical protein
MGTKGGGGADRRGTIDRNPGEGLFIKVEELLDDVEVVTVGGREE